jgi:hypothetical protein
LISHALQDPTSEPEARNTHMAMMQICSSSFVLASSQLRWLSLIQSSKISHITTALRSMNTKVEPNLKCLLLRAPAAACTNTNNKGMVWSTPFKWLSKFSKQAIKTWWPRALAKTGICPICHCADKPWHIPTLCPLIKELNLKLGILPSQPAAQPAAQSFKAPSPSPPSHGGCSLEASFGDSSVSGSAPSGLMGSALPTLPCVAEYDLDEDF